VQQLIPEELATILAETKELQSAYLVGGCVRDWLLDRPINDFDIEVFGISYGQLATALSRWGRADLVGRSFGVLKLTTASGRTFDFNLPRRESKVGIGHSGFAVELDPHITIVEAAARRDFTINALSFDPHRTQLLDFFGGEADLRNGILRHTSAAFAEDPLRVLRGMQFTARFSLRTAPETLELCRRIAPLYAELALERVWAEWLKWATSSINPSRGLHFLVDAGWIEHFPEINALRGTPQDPEWHPEGDVFIHTCHCLDALTGLPEWSAADAETRAILSFAILTHDFAKPHTTQEVIRDGHSRIISPGHEEAGGPIARQFLKRLGAPTAIEARVVPLVMNHLAHLQTLTPRGVRRLAKRLAPATIEELVTVITADSFGRPPKPKEPPQGLPQLKSLAAELQVETGAQRPILMGRHLLEQGWTPGKSMGVILTAAYEAQLEGAFSDLPQALIWLSKNHTVSQDGND
jgi:tRNA nucleotidyltransferase (CCA-adding enzyme)